VSTKKLTIFNFVDMKRNTTPRLKDIKPIDLV